MGIFSRIFSNRSDKPLFRPLSPVSRIVDSNGEPQIKRHLDGSEKLSKVEYRDQLLSEVIVANDLQNEGVESGDIEISGPSGCIECRKSEILCWIAVICARVPELPERAPAKFSKILADAQVVGARVFLASVELMPIGTDDDTGYECFFVKYLGLEEITSV
jgi:hypothetical protein